jgi:hypothetical protein
MRTGTIVDVLDIDPRHNGDATLESFEEENGKLPDGPVGLTGGGGLHNLFRSDPSHPVRNGANVLGPGVDVRGVGGYVVIPPSVHANGRVYAWNGNAHPDDLPLPAWSEPLLKRVNGATPHATPRARNVDVAGVITGVPDGGRGETLFDLACTLCRDGVPEATALEAVLFAASRCDPPFPADKAADMVRRRYAHSAPAVEAARPLPSSKIGTAEALQSYIATIRKYQFIPDVHGVYFALGIYAANHQDGDALWGLEVGAPGCGKTETIMPLAAMPDVFPASTMTEASLLSGTSKRDKAKTATGGLLRTIGDFGIILCKDFTSVLSMNREARAALLGALREIFDGSWVRHVGTDGGRTLSWSGRVGFIGACTPTIDTHHAVMASMGERFVLYRLPEATRKDLSRMAVRNSRQSTAMRGEIAASLVALFDSVDLTARPVELTDEEVERIVCLADFVTMARSPVERDGYKREIELIPDPEIPTRIAKVLVRLLDGLRAVGVDDDTAWRIVVKVSRDCVPVLRIKILDLLANGGIWTTTKIANEINYPRSTVNRACEDLNAHRFLARDTRGDGNIIDWTMNEAGTAMYFDAFGKPEVCPEMSEDVQRPPAQTPGPLKPKRTPTDISGQRSLTAIDRLVIGD